MWLRLSFSLFGREIWALQVDQDHGKFLELEDDSEEYEEEEEEEEQPLRWGEPAVFERNVFVGEHTA